jgi:hypothetical protein
MIPALIVLLVYALHQDVWLWRQAGPLVFGVLPVGLAYHAVYTLAVPLLMAYLIRRLWPAHLEHAGRPPDIVPPDETPRRRPAVPAGRETAR